MASARLKPPSCSVFFGNLHPEVTDKHLLELGCQVSAQARSRDAEDGCHGRHCCTESNTLLSCRLALFSELSGRKTLYLGS